MRHPTLRVIAVVIVAFAGLMGFLHAATRAPSVYAEPSPGSWASPARVAAYERARDPSMHPGETGHPSLDTERAEGETQRNPTVLQSAADAEPWATVYVFITEDGFDPETITVTVGTKVVWTNAMTESVTVAGEGFELKIYLPLVLRGTGVPASQVTVHPAWAPASADRAQSSVQLDPGESIARTFTQADLYEYEAGGAATGTGRIRVRPHKIDAPALAWATGPAGILLRWRWPHTDPATGGVAPQPTGYNVYRNGVKLNATPIARETQTIPFQATMGSHWQWFKETYTDVTTISDFHRFLDANPLAEHWLADQRYPIALVRGLGYLDTTASPSTPYIYEVEAIVGGAPTAMGTLTVTNQGITPVTPPNVITATTVVSDGLRSSPDWPVAQRNRQAHGRIYMVWDLPEPAPGQTAPQIWTTSYDVFRAGPVAQGQNPGALTYQKLTTEEPVVPMPDHQPAPITTTRDLYGKLPYDQHTFYFVDEVLTPCTTFAYRVAARDLLGQAGTASTWITATVPDTMPPDPPEEIAATPDHLGGTIALTWTAATDAVSYTVYRAETPTAGWPGITNCATTPCWTAVAGTASTSWTDYAAAYEQRYWYTVRAWDAPCGNYPPNGSAPSLAVAGTLHDRTPPGDPTVVADPDAPVIHITPDPDTTYSLFYYRFDEDPTDGDVPPRILITEIPSTTTSFDVSAYYSTSLPISVTCWAQPVDANGNRGNLVEVDRAVTVCPNQTYTLTTPTLDTLLTEQGGTYGWTAVLSWTVDAALPQVKGYRVYRQEGTGTLADVTSLAGTPLLDRSERTFRDTQVKPGEVYTYVLAAVRPACGFEFPVDAEVRSGPRLYTIRPTLDTPDLDPCVRPVADVGWDARPQVIPQGVYMRWRHPYGDQATMLSVIYRSRRKDGDYVAITPPFSTMTGEYTDAQAPDTQYWYIATVLNWATGEIVYRTPPTSVIGSGLTALVPTASLPEGPRMRLPRSDAEAEPAASRSPAALTASPAVLNPSDDATVDEASPDGNYGTDEHLYLRYETEVMGTRQRAFVRFDLASIPVGSIIDYAEFAAYVDLLTTVPQDEPVGVGLHTAQSAWDEDLVTWNNQPGLASSAITRTVITRTQWITWEITELTDYWYKNASANYGFGLDSAQVLDHQVGFGSREDAVNPPRMIVHYFAPPDVLRFGAGTDNLFEVSDISYASGSTPDCLTGQGTIILGGGDLGTTYPRMASFTCIQADYGSGNVLTGTATVNLQGSIQVTYPEGFSYTLTALTLDPDGGYGDVDLILPQGITFQFQGTSLDPVPLTTATIYQDLRFLHLRPSWTSTCNGGTPTFAFAMEPLPLLIVPTSGVTLTERAVEVGNACTHYVERYSSARPPFPRPDGNDGFLRPPYTATHPTTIFPAGISGIFNTMAPVSYTTHMPYGFEIAVSGGITFELHANRIDNGTMEDVAVGLDYYRKPVGKVLTSTHGFLAPTDGRFDGEALGLNIGPDGELIGDVWNGIWGTPAYSVTWASGGFRLDDEIYVLYVPPVQTHASTRPTEQSAAAWNGWDRIQAGLNRVAESPDSAAFTWQCCSSKEAITFPDGVETDLYLRRGGVSDLVVANLNPPGLSTTIYNYSTLVTSFGLSFCDNAIYDSDVAGDVDLPYPADVTIPLVDMVLNPNTACVNSGKVNTDKLTLSHWQIDVNPRRVAFRKRTMQPGDPPNWTAALWILGTMEVPHVAPAAGTGATPIPLESAWKYDGTFIQSKVVQDKVNYTFDGFRYLFKTLTLSPYTTPSPSPRWVDDATLAEPPTVISGFVKLQGNILAPSYGTVIVSGTKKPPDVTVLGWDDYVGFSAIPYVERRWTELAGLTWGFNLLYAQHHDTTTPRGAFVGFRNDSIAVAELDQALVLASWTSSPRTDLLLGLSAGTGVLRALAETTVPSLGALDTTLITSMTTWTTKLGCSAKYVDFLQAKINNKTFWSQYTSSKGYEATTSLMDAWSKGNEDEIPSTPVGGGTTSVVSDMGVHLNKMRGVVAWDTDATTGDSHFEKLNISLWLNIKQDTDTDPLVSADYINFYVNRDGDYVIIGEGIDVNVYEYNMNTIDVYIGINVKQPSFEGNVAIYKLEVEGLILEKAAAVIGVGSDLFYVGALVHDAHPKYSDSYKLGGAILLGRIDPTSKVLQAGSFGSILKDIGATGGKLTQGNLNGAYIRVYGQFPIYDYGCTFRVKAGGEIAGWYFAEDNGCSAYGGRLRANVTGKLLCVVSGRGDLTLQIYRNTLGSDTCAGSASFKGQFWVAGGIGFCDPDSWKSWESRWWGDSWCWTAGAMIGADYNETETDGWHWEYDADYE
jgi:plastocyanin